MHLLRECEISKRLWSDVSEYIYDNSGLRINMSDVDVLLGVVGAGDTELLNLIHIIVKQHIYACRCNKIHPTMASTKMKIKHIHDIEKSIAIKTDTLDLHNTKWQLLSPLT